MANQVTGNPWIIDTASGSAILTSMAQVRSFRWTGGTTAGHSCVVQDQNGKVVWDSFANGANFLDEKVFEERHGRTVNGLIVPTLGSGKLYIDFVQ